MGLLLLAQVVSVYERISSAEHGTPVPQPPPQLSFAALDSCADPPWRDEVAA